MNKLKTVLLIFLLIIVGIACYFFFGNFSDGYRGGTMIKFSKRGYVFKTYEGELNLGMVLSDHPGANVSVSNLWTFSVPSSRKEEIKKLEHALLTGKRVKVHYNEKFFRFPWRGDTKYIVDEVEVMP